jgi:hypothetical protein
MENFNLLEALFGSNPRLDLDQHQVAVPAGDKEERLNSRRIEKKPYEEEVSILASHFGGLQAGTGLCITLQEMLQLCPRKRQRADAYKGLLGYLYNVYKIQLTIKSQKHAKD